MFVALIDCMKQSNLKNKFKIYLLAFVSFWSAAFTNAKFVELEGYLNGRSSGRFTRESNNIVTLLPKGTRGEILKSKKFNSGNYGIKIKVLAGVNKGKTFWVYHKQQNSSLKLYKQAPKNWDSSDNDKETTDVKAATNAETREEVDSVQDAPGNNDIANNYGEDLGKENESLGEALNVIDRANKEVKESDDCTDCSTTTTGTEEKSEESYKQTFLGLPAACSHLMKNDGTVGKTGKELMKIMSQNKYFDSFSKKESLGAFCPKFKKLSSDQKLHAWTYFWTVLAYHESTCQIDVEHPTHSAGQRINPTNGFGLWAAESSAHLRSSRGSACNNIRTAEGQAKCAVDTMFSTQLNKGYRADNFSGSYWGPVRRGSRQIIPFMKNYKGCF